MGRNQDRHNLVVFPAQAAECLLKILYRWGQGAGFSIPAGRWQVRRFYFFAIRKLLAIHPDPERDHVHQLVTRENQVRELGRAVSQDTDVRHKR
jgi:hypothetical protein